MVGPGVGTSDSFVGRWGAACVQLVKGIGYLLQGRLRRLSISSLTSLGALSFSPVGWHYFTATLRERNGHPDLQQAGSVLERFYASVQPSRERGFLPVHQEAAWQSTKDYFVPPWGGGKHVDPSQWFEHSCGPRKSEHVRIDWEQLKEAYGRLKRVGYRPWTSPNGFIQVTLLVHTNGTSRGLVTQGHHRAAVLSHLGYEKIWVLLHRTGESMYPRNMPDTVYLQDVASWPNVRNGLFSVRDAVAFFEQYFTLSSEERLLGTPEKDPGPVREAVSQEIQ